MNGQPEKYRDLLECAFDQVKAVEARGEQGPALARQTQWVLAGLWSLLAIATEVRKLRQDLARARKAESNGRSE